MQYLWVINGETELSQLLASDDLSCIPYTDYYSYATRAWNPEDCDPQDDECIFADIYGGCWGDDEGPEEPELTLTNFTSYEVQTLDSYANGTSATVTLPQVDVNDGVHVKAVLDTVGLEGPYGAAAGLYYDANFSGALDEGDFNVLQWSEDGDADDVLIVADNGPDDMNPDEGVYETIIYADSDQGGFLTTQGATYFMAAIGLDTVSYTHLTLPTSDLV